MQKYSLDFNYILFYVFFLLPLNQLCFVTEATIFSSSDTAKQLCLKKVAQPNFSCTLNFHFDLMFFYWQYFCPKKNYQKKTKVWGTFWVFGIFYIYILRCLVNSKKIPMIIIPNMFSNIIPLVCRQLCNNYFWLLFDINQILLYHATLL